MSVSPALETAKQIIREIDWLGGWGDEIKFDEADWSDPPRVYLSGIRGADGARISATFVIQDFDIEYPLDEDDE